MRLLDAPIHKQAADLTPEQTTEMMKSILIGTAGGAGAGALTQYLLTGKAGWAGAGIGAAGGAAVGAGLDDNARRKINELFTGAEKKPEPPPVTQPDTQPVPVATEEVPAEVAATKPEEAKELSQEEYNTRIRALVTQVQANPENYPEGALQEANDLSAVFSVEESAPTVLKMIGDDEGLRNVAIDYAVRFNSKNGRTPNNEELGAFTNAVKSNAISTSGHIDEWLGGTHDKQNEEEMNTGVNLVSGADSLTAMLLPKAIQEGAVTVGNKSIKDILHQGVKQAGKEALGKAGPALVGPPKPGMLTTGKRLALSAPSKMKGALTGIPSKLSSVYNVLKSPVTTQGVKNVGSDIVKSTLGAGARTGLGAGKLGLNLGKSLFTPKFLAANVILDAPSLYIDPETGEIDYWNWMNNVKKQEAMMVNRESKRNPYVNSALGALKGAVSPWTTAPVAVQRALLNRKQINDAVDERGGAAGLGAVKESLAAFVPGMGDYQAPVTMEEQQDLEIKQAYINNKGKKGKLEDGREFDIETKYEPRQFMKMKQQGYTPAQLPNGTYGWKSPGGTYSGQTKLNAVDRWRLIERAKKLTPKKKVTSGEVYHKAPTWLEKAQFKANKNIRERKERGDLL